VLFCALERQNGSKKKAKKTESSKNAAEVFMAQRSAMATIVSTEIKRSQLYFHEAMDHGKLNLLQSEQTYLI